MNPLFYNLPDPEEIILLREYIATLSQRLEAWERYQDTLQIPLTKIEELRSMLELAKSVLADKQTKFISSLPGIDELRNEETVLDREIQVEARCIQNLQSRIESDHDQSQQFEGMSSSAMDFYRMIMNKLRKCIKLLESMQPVSQ